MEEETIKSYFEADHDRLDGLFTNYQLWKREDFPRAKEAFVAFKFGLQRHIVWEEEILFPLFESKTGITQGPTKVMRSEHKQIAEHLEAIHKKVQKADPKTDTEEQALLTTLSLHNMKEEQILYPAIDSFMTQADRTAVFDAMKKIPEERYLYCCESA